MSFVKVAGNKSLLYIGNKLSHKGFTPTGIEYLGPILEKLGFTMYYAGSKINPYRRLAQMVMSIVRHFKVDAVLIDTYSSKAFYIAFICGMLSRALRIPYIIILHGGNFPDRRRNSPRLTHMLFRNSLKVVSVSKYLKSDLAGFWDCVYIPNSIQLNNYPFSLRSRVRPSLLWVRSFHQIYNPDLALEVMKLLRPQFPSATLIMVGPDKDGSLERLKVKVRRAEMDGCITFTGKLSKPEWIKLSAQCDIFINTTNADNMPVSVMEAMALGLPVISTGVGGIPYLIDDCQDGLLVPPNNSAAFVSAIETLIGSSGLATKLSDNARKKIESFDEEVVGLQWKQLLNSLEL